MKKIDIVVQSLKASTKKLDVPEFAKDLKIFQVTESVISQEKIELYKSLEEKEQFMVVPDVIFVEKIAKLLVPGSSENSVVNISVESFPFVLAWVDNRFLDDKFVEDVFGKEAKVKEILSKRTVKDCPVVVSGPQNNVIVVLVDKEKPGMYNRYDLEKLEVLQEPEPQVEEIL